MKKEKEMKPFKSFFVKTGTDISQGDWQKNSYRVYCFKGKYKEELIEEIHPHPEIKSSYKIVEIKISEDFVGRIIQTTHSNLCYQNQVLFNNLTEKEEKKLQKIIKKEIEEEEKKLRQEKRKRTILVKEGMDCTCGVDLLYSYTILCKQGNYTEEVIKRIDPNPRSPALIRTHYSIIKVELSLDFIGEVKQYISRGPGWSISRCEVLYNNMEEEDKIIEKK